MTPAARPVEPDPIESEPEAEHAEPVEVSEPVAEPTETAEEEPEEDPLVKVYLVRVQRALAASAAKQEWDDGLDRRSARRHRIAGMMTDFINPQGRGISRYFSIASRVKSVLNRNSGFRSDVERGLARRKQERAQRDTAILEAANESAPVPEAPDYWSMENIKSLINSNSGNPRRR